MVRQPLVGQDLLIIEASLSHSETPRSVGLLWTNDRPVVETSTWQHTTLSRDRYPCTRRDSNPQPQQANGRRLHLRPRGCWDWRPRVLENLIYEGAGLEKEEYWFEPVLQVHTPLSSLSIYFYLPHFKFVAKKMLFLGRKIMEGHLRTFLPSPKLRLWILPYLLERRTELAYAYEKK